MYRKQVIEMKIIGLIASIVLTVGFVWFPTESSAQGSGPGNAPEGMIVTRHFTGIWNQVDQEAQGIALEVVEQFDDSRRAVAYWYTYGADRKTAWYVGIGDLVENRIEFELFDSTDVGFLQGAIPGNDSVQSIGTMTIVFDSCDSGVVTFETNHAEVGSGTFNIERLTEVMNTHCTGGISDDMHADALFGEQRIDLMSARQGVNGSGHANYEDYSGHMGFEIEVEGLPDGEYRLYTGMQERGTFSVVGGHGELSFSSPGEDGHMLLNFDPRGMVIEIHDGAGVVLSSFDYKFEEDGHGHHHDGDTGHHYDCEYGAGGGNGGGMGGHMGGHMLECVDAGDYVGIESDFVNTGVLVDADGEVKWEMNAERVEFSVEIEGVPVGSYPLHVGGNEVGIITTFQMHYGDVYGHIRFRDPEAYGREPLDFEPRGQRIEVLQDDVVILEIEFPTE